MHRLTQTDHKAAIKELTKIALVNRMSLLVAWTPTEAGRYLEMYKAFEQRPPDMIRTRVGDTYLNQLTAALTSIRGINKTDVMTLATRVGSLEAIASAPPDTFRMLPGMGEVKVENLTKALRQPFRTAPARHAPGPTESAAPGPPAADAAADAPDDAASDSSGEAALPALPFDTLPDNFASLPEEEQLRLAMEMSMENS